MHPPSSKKKAAPTETRTHNIYGRWVVLKKSKNPGGWKEAKSKKYQPHGDFRLKIQTRFQSRHPVNTYSRNGIYTYTHIQNVLHWRVNHGWSSLVVLRLHREQRPLARFRMECVFFFFYILFFLFLSSSRTFPMRLSGFSRYRRCVRTSRAARHREHKTTPLRRTATMHCHRLSLVWSALIDQNRERERERNASVEEYKASTRGIFQTQKGIFFGGGLKFQPEKGKIFSRKKN